AGTAGPTTGTTGPTAGAGASAAARTSAGASAGAGRPARAVSIGRVTRISRRMGISISTGLIGTRIHGPLIPVIVMVMRHRHGGSGNQGKAEQSAVDQLRFHVFLRDIFRGLHQNRKNHSPMVQPPFKWGQINIKFLMLI